MRYHYPQLKYCFIFFFSLSSVYSVAQRSSPDSIVAFFTRNEIKLDGKLDEEAWANAIHISNFTQRELNVDEPGTERTEVAIVYTTKSLFVGVWCYDSEPNKLVAKELKRDFDHSLDDNFEIIIDTYNDDRNGFLFVTNPNGAREDAQVLDNGASVNKFYNGVWNVKTTITAQGWFAEFEIPFYTLKFRSGIKKQVWGINFERNIRRKREQVLWQGWSRDSDLELVNKAGTLIRLDSLLNKQYVEVKPYGIAGNEFNRYAKDKSKSNIGGDINYLVTPTLRLNLTANTDFAQVESDREVINLTRFPVFFPERREFFLEGQDYFNMQLGSRILPFYSRRIGLNEDRQTVPIIAGLRLLGKVNNSTIGAMSIQTAEQGETPTSNYSVLSFRQDVLDQSTIGLMTTNKFENGRWFSSTGGYGRYSTSKFLRNKNLNVGASYVQNFYNDTTIRDASAHRIFLSYPNDRIQFDAAWQRSATNFNPEVGFLTRSNFQEIYAELELNPRPKNFLKWVRRFSFKPLDMNYFIYDDTHELQSFSYEIRPLGFWTRSGEFFELNVQRRAEGLRESFEITDGITIPAGEYWMNRLEVQASTFRGRSLSFDTYINWGDFYTGNITESEFSLLWRINKFLSTTVSYERNWVNLSEGAFITDLINTRFDYAVSPNVFGSFFSQWNTEDEEVILNYRLQIIPKIGADLFFIVNQVFDTSQKKMDHQKTVIIGKLIWRIVL
ncbi:MAG: DUF5916 domain-containing protein [Chryseolinea sp.]